MQTYQSHMVLYCHPKASSVRRQRSFPEEEEEEEEEEEKEQQQQQQQFYNA